MRRIAWQVFTLVSPGLINPGEKTGGTVCLNPWGYDKKREWRKYGEDGPGCSFENKNPARIQYKHVNVATSTHMDTPTKTPWAIKTHSSVFLFLPCFSTLDVAFKWISVWSQSIMVWLLKDEEVDMNEAPCCCRPVVETEARAQKVTDWFWKRAKDDSKRRQEEKEGEKRPKNIKAKRKFGTKAT